MTGEGEGIQSSQFGHRCVISEPQSPRPDLDWRQLSSYSQLIILKCFLVRPSLEPGWLEGNLDGKFGLVPENYVEFIS